jgi:tripartite-type tricarboxylate transporter receptor subunit TctC
MNLGKQIGIVVFVTVSALTVGVLAGATEYPTKAVTLVIPYPPGGSTDLSSRALANSIRKHLGQPIVCENKPGGGGTVGPSLVITKPSDGYTLGIITGSPSIAYHMGKLNFHPIDDVTHIVRWGGFLFGLVVRADAPWKSLQDLVEYSRKNPGKITYGSPGVGTPTHLAVEELASVAGFQWTHMPFKGGAETMTALLGGHIDVLSDSSGWAPLVDAGKFRLLANWGLQRSPRYPDVPTAKEIYGVASPGFLALMGPKGIPKSIVQQIQEASRKATEDPEFKEALKKLDMAILYQNTDEYEKFVRQDFESIGKVVKTLGLDKK